MKLLSSLRCPVCDGVPEAGFDETGGLCRSCWARFFSGEPQPPAGNCRLCRQILLGELELCADCARRNWSFQTLDGLVPYQSAAGELLRAYKGRGRTALASWWARLAASLVDLEAPLVPVPFHPQHYRERGWDPVGSWARALSRQTKLPVLNVLRRRPTASQKSLGRAQRIENAFKSFVLRYGSHRRLAGLPLIWLLDDVVTTGSTVEACAKELLAAGVLEVRVLCLCLH